MKNPKLYKIRYTRIALLVISLTVGIGYFYAKYNCVTDVTKYRKEYFTVNQQVKENAEFESQTRLLTSLSEIPSYRVGGYFTGETYYYADIQTTIKNISPKAANYLVYNYVDPIQGTVWGKEEKGSLDPGESYRFSQQLIFPSGSNTEFAPSSSKYGSYLETSEIEYDIKISKCKWVKYVIKCNYIFDDCTSYLKSNLSSECHSEDSNLHLNLDLCNSDINDFVFPIEGFVDTKYSNLSLRSKPSVSGKTLKNSDILIEMPSKSSLKILSIDEDNVKISAGSGRWIKVKYNHSNGNIFEGYAWCNNIGIK
jgi:hypothetical protein